jgi:branched-subunit amino acid transport protein
VSEIWLAVLLIGVGTVVLKSTGPLLLAGRTLPPLAMSVVQLFGPALLAALVVTQALGGDRELVVDARLAGVGAAAVAIAARLPLALIIVLAAVATALARIAV